MSAPEREERPGVPARDDLLAACREALLLARDTLRAMGGAGRDEVHDAHVTDISTRGDMAVSAALSGYFRHLGWPVTLWSEESGARGLHPAPMLTVAFDDLDGTDNYFRGAGLLPYCTVLCILEGTEPRFADALAAGVLEHNSGRLWLASRDGGCRLDGVPVHSARRTRLDRRSAVIVDHYSSAGDITAFQGLYEQAWIKDFGTSALHLAGVASGLFDAYVGSAQKAHELGAGYLLIREAGGCLMDWDGRPLDDRPYVFTDRYPLVAAGTRELAEAVRGRLRRTPPA